MLLINNGCFHTSTSDKVLYPFVRIPHVLLIVGQLSRMQEDSPCAMKTRQALLIPELLRRIFELSTDWANRSNALVCKVWCEEALSVLWSDVEAPQLFGLLAPMKLEGSEVSKDLDREADVLKPA